MLPACQVCVNTGLGTRARFGIIVLRRVVALRNGLARLLSIDADRHLVHPPIRGFRHPKWLDGVAVVLL
jgi:hypothetical protein